MNLLELWILRKILLRAVRAGEDFIVLDMFTETWVKEKGCSRKSAIKDLFGRYWP